MADFAWPMSLGKLRMNENPTPPPGQQSKRRRMTGDRVIINVGGTIFCTSVFTLSTSCRYFGRFFAGDWVQAQQGEEIFLDRDADTFRVLLSCMRHNTVLLPENDTDLCRRVLLDAEFLGIDWLLREVKHQALQNISLEPPYDESDADGVAKYEAKCREYQEILADPARSAEKFDELFGGTRGALKSGLLPMRYFSKANPFAERSKIKQLISAPTADRVVFSGGQNGQQTASARPVAYALVEEPGGNQYMDAVIVSRNPTSAGQAFSEHDEQMVLASQYVHEKREDWENGHSWGVVQGQHEGLPPLDGDMHI